MFKFLKSKKGFTLVELMIVVVIMAILVAVAVPIFSAVTKNARIKTCAGNRREIISQVNQYIMGSIDGQQHPDGLNFTITSNGEEGALASGTTAAVSGVVDNLFQELPYCPFGSDDTAVTYVVTSTKEDVSDDSSATKVAVVCNATEDHMGTDAE